MNKTITQILETQRPEQISKPTLDELRNAFGAFEENNFKPTELQEKFIDPVSKIEFKVVDDIKKFLSPYIKDEIPNKYYGVLIEHWYENFTEAPQYEVQNQTTLDSSTLDQLEKEAEVMEQQKQETVENSKKAVEEAQQKLREIKARNDEILKQLEKQKEKKLYVEIKSPTEEQFTKEETLDFDNYKEYLKSVKPDEIPEAVDKLAQEIESRVGESLRKQGLDNDDIKLVIENTAVEIIDNLIRSDDPQYFPPTHVEAVTLSFAKNPEEIKKITKDEVTQNLIKENARFTAPETLLQGYSRTVAEASFGPKFASRVFGPKPENLTVSISETPQPTSTETYSPYVAVRSAQMSLENHDQNLEELKQRGLEEGKKVLVRDARSLIRQRLGLIHPQSTAGRFLQSNKGDYILRAFGVGPQDGLSLIEKVAFNYGIPITAGVRTALWAKATTQTAISIANTGGLYASEAYLGGAAVSQAAGKVATNVGVKASFGALLAKGAAAIGVSLGVFTAGVSTAVTLILTAIGKMINWPKVKEWLRKNGWILGLGAVAINPWLGLGLAGAMYGLTRQIRLAAIGAGIWGFFGAIGSAFVMTIATPIIVTLLVLPPLVAFIMLVINTGAYLVPPDPKSLGLNVDNPYLLVAKKADPDAFPNPTSGKVTVTYTVTITALKSTLTNLKIVEKKCTVSKKNASTQLPCPTGFEKISDLPADLTVSPASSYSFTFTTEVDSSYADSSIFDSIKIGADTGEKKGITTSGSESVCVGDCPKGCFEIVDNDESWPNNFKETLDQATKELVSGFPNFSEKACSERPTVNLCYTTKDPSPIGTGGQLCVDSYYGWHSHSDSCDIIFNQCGVDGEVSDALFLLTHELTHHIQKFDGDLIKRYRNSGGPDELPICSYRSMGANEDEGSAEANGLYVSIPSWGTCASSFKSLYPKNYTFANDYVNNP